MGIDLSKVLGGAGKGVSDFINKTSEDNQHPDTGTSAINHCPSCGHPISSLTGKCPACGCEINNSPTSSVQTLIATLAKIDSKKESIVSGLIRSIKETQSNKTSSKLETIKNFPLPYTKKELLELIQLAASNVDAKIFTAQEARETGLSTEDFKSQKLLVQAWAEKMESTYQKACSLFASDNDFTMLRNIYTSKKEEIEQLYKKKRRKKSVAIACSVGSLVALAILIVCFVILPHYEKEKKLDSIAAEIRADIERGDYESALIKTNQLHMDDGYSSESEQRWDNEREGYISLINEKMIEKGSVSVPSSAPIESSGSTTDPVYESNSMSIESEAYNFSNHSLTNSFYTIANSAPHLDINQILPDIPETLVPGYQQSGWGYYFFLKSAAENGTITESHAATLAQYTAAFLDKVDDDYIHFYHKHKRLSQEIAVSFSSGLAVCYEGASSKTVKYGSVSGEKHSRFTVSWQDGHTMQLKYYIDEQGNESILTPSGETTVYRVTDDDPFYLFVGAIKYLGLLK